MGRAIPRALVTLAAGRRAAAPAAGFWVFAIGVCATDTGFIDPAISTPLKRQKAQPP